MLSARIVGTGVHLPPTVQTSPELEPLLGVPAGWVEAHTGIRERRIAQEPMHKLAAHAAREALGKGGPPDLLINASLTPLQLIPDSSVFILQELGLDGRPSFSVHATCLSFVVGLQVAMSLVHGGLYRRVLLVSAEQGSVCRDLEQAESAALIGDGAGAAVIEPTPPGGESRLLAFAMATWPEGAEHTELRGCGTRKHPNDPATVAKDNLFQMNGPAVYKMALRKGPPLIGALLREAGLRPSEVDLVVPHQTSGPAMRAYQKVGFAPDQIVDIIAETGNCIAASVPMALALAERQGRLRRGDRVLLVGTGAGLSVAGALLRW